MQSKEDVVSPKGIKQTIDLDLKPMEMISFSDNHNLDEYIIGR